MVSSTQLSKRHQTKDVHTKLQTFTLSYTTQQTLHLCLTQHCRTAPLSYTVILQTFIITLHKHSRHYTSVQHNTADIHHCSTQHCRPVPMSYTILHTFTIAGQHNTADITSLFNTTLQTCPIVLNNTGCSTQPCRSAPMSYTILQTFTNALHNTAYITFTVLHNTANLYHSATQHYRK